MMADHVVFNETSAAIPHSLPALPVPARVERRPVRASVALGRRQPRTQVRQNFELRKRLMESADLLLAGALQDGRVNLCALLEARMKPYYAQRGKAKDR